MAAGIFKNISTNLAQNSDQLDDLFSGDRFLRRDDLINLFNKQAPTDDMTDSMDNKPQRPKIDNLGGIKIFFFLKKYLNYSDRGKIN